MTEWLTTPISRKMHRAELDALILMAIRAGHTPDARFRNNDQRVRWLEAVRLIEIPPSEEEIEEGPASELRQFVEQYERIEAEIKDLRDQQTEVLAEALSLIHI